jgi:hypothetical protein
MGGRAHLGAFALIAALAPSIAVAQGQTLRTFTVGPWQAAAYAYDGRFARCAATTNYAGGFTMRFSIDRQYRWNLGLMHRNWRLIRDEEFDVAFKIDDGNPIIARARALDSTRALIALASRAELFERFRRGRVLRITAGGEVLSFNLEGSSAMLAQLHDCVDRYVRPAATVAGSSSEKRPTIPNTRATLENPTLQAEAAVLLANVMSAANVSGYSMATPEEALKRSAHAAWTAPSVVGSLLIIPVRRVDDPEIPGLVTGINATGCKGAFMSASLPSDGRVVRVTTTCQPQGQPLRTSYYFGIPRPRGGLYLFITDAASDGGREDVERADEMIRQASLRTVN